MAEQLYTTLHPSGRDKKLDVYNNAAVLSRMPRSETQVFPGRKFGRLAVDVEVGLETQEGASV